MPRASFTARLMLAMMLTVVIVTSGALWVLSQRVETSYLRLFEERFQSQIDSFSGMQTVRLESIRQRCRMLAASAEVVEALQLGSGDLPDGMLKDLKAKARVVRDSATAFDARAQEEILDSSGESLAADATLSGPDSSAAPGSGSTSPPTPGTAAINISALSTSTSTTIGGENGGTFTRRGSLTSFAPRRRPLRLEPPEFVDLALISSLGRVYSLKSGASSSNSSNSTSTSPANSGADSPRWLEDDRISRVPVEQQTGYVMVPTEFPREVILTPVHDPASGETLGALAVGLPFTGYGESSLYDLNRPGKPGNISIGLWLQDHLFTSTIATADQGTLKEQIRLAIQKQKQRAEPAEVSDLTISERVELSGKPYQMLLRQLSTDSVLPTAWGVMLTSLSGMAAEQRALRNEILTASAAALGVALLLSYFLSRGLMRPVQALVRGTREIREGNYTARVRIRQTDEIGHLGESFNEMAAGLQQREQYHSILIQLSDYNVARRLIASPSLGGERRDVSVLFCDIRNFTAISGAMTPEDVIAMLNEHMTALTESVHRHHGVVDKFVGDLIMAVFGAPENAENHPGDAARCALSMMERRQELNAVTTHPVLEIGIGIASGVCLAGCMGSENRLNYTVLGEHVNLAARLCSAAAPGEILLAPDSASRLDAGFEAKALAPQTFKGFARPVTPFRLEKSGLPTTTTT